MATANNGNLGRLQDDLKHIPLIPIVGAGVSANYIPPWKPFLKQLTDKAVDQCLGRLSPQDRQTIKAIVAEDRQDGFSSLPYAQAAIVKRLLGKQYLAEFRQLLYARLASKAPWILLEHWDQPHDLLAPVARLCTCRQVRAVVTYNFDDLLERAVECMNRAVHTVYGARQTTAAQDRLTFYHVHGYVPSAGPLPSAQEAAVVFAQEELFETLLHPFSWQSVVQLHLLRECVCLFVGASMKDFAMLRALSHARAYLSPGVNRCYGLMCRKALVGDAYQADRARADLAIRVWSAFLDHVGVRLILTGDDFDSVVSCVTALHDHLISDAASH